MTTLETNAPIEGLFVVFEGIDRSGKSTLSQRLVRRLRSAGQKAELMRFPNRDSAIGELLDKYLRGNIDSSGHASEAVPNDTTSAVATDSGSSNGKGKKSVALPDEAIHLLFSANRWEVGSQIEAMLRGGVTVVADRYAFSGAAYAEGAQGLPRSWCRSTDERLLAPDIVFYLDLPPSVAATRSEYGGERYENATTQEKVYKAYEQFDSLSYWKKLDAKLPVDELDDLIWEETDKKMAKTKDARQCRLRLWNEK